MPMEHLYFFYYYVHVKKKRVDFDETLNVFKEKK